MQISESVNYLFKKPSSLFPFVCVFVIIWLLNTFIFPSQLHDWLVYQPAQGETSRWLVILSGWLFHAPTFLPVGGTGGIFLYTWGVFHIITSCFFIHVTSSILDYQWGKGRTVISFLLIQIIAWAILMFLVGRLGWSVRGAGSSTYGISGMVGVIIAYCIFSKDFWNKWKSNVYFRLIPVSIMIGILRGSWLTSLIYITTIILGFLAYCGLSHKRSVE